MNEPVSPEIQELLRKLEEANARIAELEKREAEKDIRIEKQSAEIKAQEDEIKNLKETIASLMGHQFGKQAEDYMRNVFEKAPYCETQEDWEKLLPWNIEMTPFNEEDGWC